MASKLADAFAPEYQSSGPEWLRLIGAVANRVRGGGLAPDATTVAGFLPGAGFVQGNQDAGKARASFGRGEYGQAAIDMGNSMLGTASELPGLGGLAKFAMATVPAARRGIQAFTKGTDLPDLRRLPVDEAVAIAKRDPHLIKSGDHAEGLYVGGPRSIQSKRGLTNLRNQFDAYVGADPRGGDWYDRYRAFTSSVTGNNPKDNLWMSNQEGQWSAGVDPGSEFHFALKENNASLAGMPTKSARPAQHEAHLRAIEANDPSKYQLGDKTGEYASLINPDRPGPSGATGVNDFRHARNFQYTDPNGNPQKNALTAGQHRFLDYETAAAVGRANDSNLGGRTDWTGEKLQAAPWVRQKALDTMRDRNLVRNWQATYDKLAAKGQRPNWSPEEKAYEEAFEFANKTIADFAPKHTAFATHEAFPGADTGHLPGSVDASPLQRFAYSTDPRSTWANAPGGRDAIYGGMRLGDTGVAMRVQPTTEMQGLYTPPSGITESNRGEVARPLVTFDSGDVKKITPADEALLNAGEATRGYIDAQNASAWHKNWAGESVKDSTSFFAPLDRAASTDELIAARNAAGQYGLEDVVDTGQGITATRFYPGPLEEPVDRKGMANLADQFKQIFPDMQKLDRSKVDSGYIDYVDQWKAGEGSGEATRKMLSYVNKTPEIRAALNNNPYIPQNAMARMERDADYAAQFGATRQDIQNARQIIGEGTGWVDRLEEGLKSGALLPALAVAFLGGAAALRQPGEASNPGQL